MGRRAARKGGAGTKWHSSKTGSQKPKADTVCYSGHARCVSTAAGTLPPDCREGRAAGPTPALPGDSRPPECRREEAEPGGFSRPLRPGDKARRPGRQVPALSQDPPAPAPRGGGPAPSARSTTRSGGWRPLPARPPRCPHPQGWHLPKPAAPPPAPRAALPRLPAAAAAAAPPRHKPGFVQNHAPSAIPPPHPIIRWALPARAPLSARPSAPPPRLSGWLPSPRPFRGALPLPLATRASRHSARRGSTLQLHVTPSGRSVKAFAGKVPSGRAGRGRARLRLQLRVFLIF